MKLYRPIVWACLATLLVLAGCAARPNVPPITTADSAPHRDGHFVWYDLLTDDLPKAKRFYGALLGWTFTDTEIPYYTMIEHRGRSIGGIVDTRDRDAKINTSQWISVLSTRDVDAAARDTSAAGGAIHVKPTDLPGRGRLAVVSDPQGALVALLRTTTGDPPRREPGMGDWMWTELWTGDLEASAEYYTGLAGFEVDERLILEDIVYTVFTRGATPRAGVIPLPDEKVRAHWLPYVRVEDPAALARQIEALGGRVLLDPSEGARKGTVAIVLDPSGAPLALQQWEGA